VHVVGFKEASEVFHSSVKQKSRAKQRGTSEELEVCGVVRCRTRPSCLAGYFTWPQVALTHHVFRKCLYASRRAAVKSKDEEENELGGMNDELKAERLIIHRSAFRITP
jgi:hypothetical protein